MYYSFDHPGIEALKEGIESLADYENARLASGWTAVPRPPGPTGYAKEEPYIDGSCLQWLVENVGKMVFVEDKRDIEGNGDWDLVKGHVLFRDPRKAILFKLTWGGEI
jgi:hypothetical protein